MSASDRGDPAPKKGSKGVDRAARSASKEGERDKDKARDREAANAKEAPREKDAAPAKAAEDTADPPRKPVAIEENRWVALAQKNAWILVPALLPAAILAGLLQGAQAVLLLLIGSALVGVIALFWNSLRTLLGETPLTGADAYALAAPRAEEEQKQAVLRALKDLDFERSVGKISEEDYAALVAKYRAEAKRLLRAIEEEARPRRESVEWLVHERLVKAGLAEPADTFSFRSGPSEIAAKPEPAGDAKKGKKKKMKDADKPVVPPREVEITPEERPAEEVATAARKNVDVTLKSHAPTTTTKESPAYVPPTKRCASCGAKNDPDANFCKKCGSKSFEPAGGTAPKADTVTARDEAARDEAAHDEAAHDEAAHDEAEAAHESETEEAQR